MIEPGVSGLQNMPMMFRDLDDVEYVIEKLRPTLEKRMEEKGFKILFWGDAGWVRFFSRAQIQTPADLKKQKMFVWAGDPNTLDSMRDLGFKPVALETNDILPGLKTGLIDAVQVVYNIFDQNPEDALFPACRKHDVAVIARVPFDEGSLTGTLTQESTWPRGDFRNAYFTKENLTATLPRVSALRPSVPAGLTLPEIALRFILNSSDVSTIIPGMRKRRHVENNLAASSAGPLPAELLKKLRICVRFRHHTALIEVKHA